MNVYEFLFVMSLIGFFAWYCWRVTRVSQAIEDFAAADAQARELDEALFVEVTRYVSNVVLPELHCNLALRRLDDERTAHARQLVAALSARTSHRLGLPDPMADHPESPN